MHSGEPLIETSRLRAFRMPAASDTLMVTFSHYVDAAGQSAPFGVSFLASHGIDAVHIVAKDNHWFELSEMGSLIEAIRAVAGGRRLIAYGSSMGGYAAIRFARALGAERAVAISPQYALDKARVPFERRWRSEARRLRLPRTQVDLAAPPATIFFDPRNPDAAHVAAWSRERRVEVVALPYAGHPAGTYLVQVGLLGESLLAIVSGVFDARSLEREAHARRRRSGQYLSQLAAAQPGHRRRIALALATKAVEVAPAAVDYHAFYASLLYRAGHDAEAESAHRAALAVAPGDPLASYRLSRFLQRTGRYAEALEAANAALQAHPGSGALRHHRRAVLNSVRTPLNPLRAWARLINRLRHRHNRVGWTRWWPLLDRLLRP